MKNYKNSPYLVLLGIIIIRGFASGAINMTSSLFLSPVAKDIGVGIGTISLYFSIMAVVTVLFLPYGGRLMAKKGVKSLVFVSAIFMALTFASFGLLNNVFGWYALSIPQAMGAVILVNLLGPVLINRFFPDNTGFILGLHMAFVWIFAAVLQPVTTSVIESFGWRNAYFFDGLITFAAVCAALFLLKDRPENAGIKKEKTAQNADGAVEIAESEAVKSISFYMLLIFMLVMTGAAVFTQHIPTYGTLIGYSLNQVGIAMSLSSVGSAVGALAIGVVSDKIGGLKTCFGIIALWIAAVIAFIFSSGGFWVFALASFCHGIASSSIAVIGPILTLIFYGKGDYEKIFAKVAMGAPLASILLIPAYGYIYDLTDSYLSVLVMLILLLLAAAFSIAFGWKNRCTHSGCPTWKKAG